MPLTKDQRAERARQNGKHGGRPPGSQNKITLQRKEVLKAMQQRIMEGADLLLDSQWSVARGVTFLYKIEKYWEKVADKKGKEVKVLRRKPPELVTAEWEIRAYIQGLVDDVELEEGNVNKQDPEATYYFITTQKPDSRAIDSLISRAFGRHVQPVMLTDEDGEGITDDESKNTSKKAIAELLGGGNTRKGKS